MGRSGKTEMHMGFVKGVDIYWVFMSPSAISFFLDKSVEIHLSGVPTPLLAVHLVWIRLIPLHLASGDKRDPDPEK